MKNKRNTWLRRAAAFVLCAALVLMTGIFPTRVQAKSLEDLKQEYNELEKEIEANKKKLESIKNQQTSNAEKMSLLSSQAEAISIEAIVRTTSSSVKPSRTCTCCTSNTPFVNVPVLSNTTVLIFVIASK